MVATSFTMEFISLTCILCRVLEHDGLPSSKTLLNEHTLMHQSFVSTPGISGAFNFSIFKAPLKALHPGAKIVVKSLLKAPPSRGLTIMKNNKWPELFELTFLTYPIVIPHKLWLHWSCSFRENFEHTHIHRHIHTFTRKPLVLNICKCPYILVNQTQQLGIVPVKIKWGMA